MSVSSYLQEKKQNHNINLWNHNISYLLCEQ